MHGYGTLIRSNINKKFMNAFKYVGEWKNGEKDGYGTYTLDRWYKYVGEWTNGKMHGQGTKTSADGTMHYSGEWVNGKPIVSFFFCHILK